MLQGTTEELTALLRRGRVMDMPALRRAFPHRSRRSIIRDLGAVGYLASCNYSGGFYTLADIPEFDADGLWRHEQALFSRHGTLRATARHLVRTAESGQTHHELHQRLQLRVHNTLLELVSAREIAREIIDKLFLYVSADLDVQAAQVARRRTLLQRAEELPPLEPDDVIAVLLAVIHQGARQPEQVVAYLRSEGRLLSLAEVEQVFAWYELGGKKNSLSPS